MFGHVASIVLALSASTTPLISITILLLVPLLDDVMDDVVKVTYQAKQSTYSLIWKPKPYALLGHLGVVDEHDIYIHIEPLMVEGTYFEECLEVLPQSALAI